MSSASSHYKVGGSPVCPHDRRKMLTLNNPTQIEIISQLTPGKLVHPCCVCFHAPSACWCLAAIPCCKLPKDVLEEYEDSKYIYLRENSLEFNMPAITLGDPACCLPCNPCKLKVVDSVDVVYFDYSIMNKIDNQTGCCHQTCLPLCGGEGERVRLVKDCCSGMCLLTKDGCCCCPSCCPDACVGECVAQKNIYVEDANDTILQIKNAKANAEARMGLN